MSEEAEVFVSAYCIDHAVELGRLLEEANQLIHRISFPSSADSAAYAASRMASVLRKAAEKANSLRYTIEHPPTLKQRKQPLEQV